MNHIAQEYFKLAEYIENSSQNEKIKTMDHVYSIHQKVGEQLLRLSYSLNQISKISVHCDQQENCNHKVTFNDGSEKIMSLQDILMSCKMRDLSRISGGYHLKYICQQRHTLPKKKIKGLGHATQDSCPTTSGVTFVDNTSVILWGPQIYWLCHQYGTDLLNKSDQSFLEQEFSSYYINTDLFLKDH